MLLYQQPLFPSDPTAPSHLKWVTGNLISHIFAHPKKTNYYFLYAKCFQ